MAVFKYLDLSTSHLTQQEMESITGATGVRVLADEYGAWVWVPIDEFTVYLDEMREEGWPNLAAILDYARQKGCSWVQLDRDADKIDALPTFDW